MPELTIDQLLQNAKDSGIDMGALGAKVNAELGKGDKFKKNSFKKLELDSEIYNEAEKDGLTFTEKLEQLDPSENYADTKLDAYERQLAAHGIKVSGANAISLAEWYDQPASRVLFPEFINRQIQIGRLLGRYTLRTDDVVATRTEIDSGTYEAAILDTSAVKDFHSKIVGQGAKFPVITFTTTDKTISLRKRGYKIMETYEHRRRIRANKMAVALQWLGWTMVLDESEDCIDVIVNGNAGNSNAAPVYSATTLNYANFVDFLAEFHPYEADIWVTPKAGWTGILKLSEFSQHSVGNQFKTEGSPVDPFGSPIKRHDVGGSILTSKVLGVAKPFAVEEVVERGSMLSETDKIIDGQWNEIVVSFVKGYAKIIAEGARVWDYS